MHAIEKEQLWCKQLNKQEKHFSLYLVRSFMAMGLHRASIWVWREEKEAMVLVFGESLKP